MFKRFILMILVIVAFVISGCGVKNSTVEITPTTEVIEEVLVEAPGE